MIESDEIVGGERGELSCRVSAFSLGIFSPLFLSLSLSLFFCLLFLFVVVCLLKKECGASLNSISRCEMRPTGAVGMPTTPLTFRRPIRHRSFRRERKEETVAPQQKKKRERERKREKITNNNDVFFRMWADETSRFQPLLLFFLRSGSICFLLVWERRSHLLRLLQSALPQRSNENNFK